MKKIIYILTLVLIVLNGCQPLEDFYNEIEENPTLNPVTGIEITLTDDDYDLMGEEYGEPGKYNNFSASISAADFMPIFLNSEYGMLDKGSSAVVTYDYYQGGLDYLNYLISAVSYELSTADYDSFGEEYGQPGKFNNFDSGAPPGDYLPGFFATKYPNASNGDLVYVTYKYYSGGTQIRSEYYELNASIWGSVQVEVPDGVSIYSLASEDYDSMGPGPGKYNNFSSYDSPDDYLPIFLKLKFPYSNSGDIVAAVYRYYDGSDTETEADQYTFDGTYWNKYSSTVQLSDPFVVGTDGWVFNPAVVFTMTSGDYQMIVDYVDNSIGSEHVNSYGTGESYYGADAYYSNFSTSSGYYNASFATWQDAVKEAISKGLLPSKYPNATTQYKGVDVEYVVTFDTFGGGARTKPTFTFQCTKSGPNPEFTFIEK